MQELSLEAINEAIYFNDAGKLKEIFEYMELRTDGMKRPQSGAGCEILAHILRQVACNAFNDSLPADVALLTINYTSCSIDLFVLAQSVNYALRTSIKSEECVPEALRKAAKENVFNDDIQKQLEGLSVNEFKNYLAFLVDCDDVRHIKCAYTAPIVRYVYQHKLVPADLLFSFMSSCVTRLSMSDMLRGSIIAAMIG